jgi:MFS family permease
MAFLCIGLFASYYIFDIPAATEGALQQAFDGSSGNGTTCINGTSVSGGGSDDDSSVANAFNSNFNLLYSVYSWPNIILPFFGGYISDKLGVRLMGVVFMLLIAVGQLMVALGSSYITTNPQAAWYTM